MALRMDETNSQYIHELISDDEQAEHTEIDFSKSLYESNEEALLTLDPSYFLLQESNSPFDSSGENVISDTCSNTNLSMGSNLYKDEIIDPVMRKQTTYKKRLRYAEEKLPFKKRKIFAEENCMLDGDVTAYPASRQLSIADLLNCRPLKITSSAKLFSPTMHHDLSKELSIAEFELNFTRLETKSERKLF